MVSPIQPFRPTATLPLQAPPPEGSAPRGRSFAGTVAPADRSQDLAFGHLLLRAVGHSLRRGGLPKFAQHGREVAAAFQTTARLTKPKLTPDQARAAAEEARKLFTEELNRLLIRKGLTEAQAATAASQIAEHFGRMNTFLKFIKGIPNWVGWGTITAPAVDPTLDFIFNQTAPLVGPVVDRVVDAIWPPDPQPAKR